MKIINQCCLLLCCSLALLATSTEAYKILCVFASPSRSHVIQGKTLAKALAKRGNQVTMVSPFPLDKPVKNYRDIDLTGVVEIVKATGFQVNFKTEFNIYMLFKFLSDNIFKIETQLSYLTLNHTNFQEVLKEKYDVIILETFFNEALTVLGHQLNAPMIGFFPSVSNAWVNDYMGAPTLYSITPNPMTAFSDDMTFFQRVANTVLNAFMTLTMDILGTVPQRKVIEHFFPNAPPLSECRRNFSLFLVNEDASFYTPKPQVPGVIMIGGFHVEDPKPLPKDLKSVLDQAKNGVVYFSMGSNLLSKDMPPENVEMFLNAFSRLDQLVLWKWEDDQLPNKPKNVIISKWFPQSDILNHTNVKVFITHGGLGSTVEAISRSVPLIFIPMFADQFSNALYGERVGFGKMMDFKTISTDTIYNTISEVLNNKTYQEKINERNRILYEKPIKAIHKATFWIEYVAKHKGAPHLRSAGLDLNLFQYYLVDVIAFLALVIALVLTILYYSFKLLRRLLRLIFRKKEKVL